MTRGIALIVIAVVLAACDSVSSSYRTVAEARSDRLFERGWLPDILPSSTTSLHITNDLDINVTEGEFSFLANDFPIFREKLNANIPSSAPFRDWGQYSGKMPSSGYTAFAFSTDDMQWVFVCNEAQGHCKFRGWHLGSAT